MTNISEKEKAGFLEIRITGIVGNVEISTELIDIREIAEIFENAENLLFPGAKKERPLISYRIENGSVRHLFSTSSQHIIGLNAVLGQITYLNAIDFLEIESARAIENIQITAQRKGYDFLLRTSLPDTNELIINRKTKFFWTEAIWSDAEFYFYGKVTNAGGKDKANIHLLTEEFGIIRIQTPISFLEGYSENILYKNLGIRAIGKQNSETGEIDVSVLSFIELIDYSPGYDEIYLKNIRGKAKSRWLRDIDPDTWINDVRGRYDT